MGPDLEHRLSGQDPEPAKVVPLPVRGPVPAPDVSSGSDWALARAILHAEDPGIYASWVSGLEKSGRAGGRLMLRAPSRFHASYVSTHLMGQILAACRSVDADIDTVLVEA